jgi:hypothetical protein
MQLQAHNTHQLIACAAVGKQQLKTASSSKAKTSVDK